MRLVDDHVHELSFSVSANALLGACDHRKTIRGVVCRAFSIANFELVIGQEIKTTFHVPRTFLDGEYRSQCLAVGMHNKC